MKGRVMRAVTHVKLCAEGGPDEEWKLTLECGHSAWRRPKYKCAHLFARGIPSEPPRRVRCLFCEVLGQDKQG